jgi:hypothetical protein
MLLRRSRVSGAIQKEAFIHGVGRFIGGVGKGLVKAKTPAKTLAGKAGVATGRVARVAALPAATLGGTAYLAHGALKGGFEQSRMGMDRRYLAAQNRGYVP